MANALGTLFSDIANAIRNKTGKTNKMTPKDFPSEIANIVVGEGGGTSNNDGWVTLIEQQTVNPTYSSSDGCYVATVPIVNVKKRNLTVGNIYMVHLDGISYPIGMSGIPIQFSSGVIANLLAAGDYGIRTRFYDMEFTSKIGAYDGYEPFFLEGRSSTSAYSTAQIMFRDDTPHIIKVDYMPRYEPPKEVVE